MGEIKVSYTGTTGHCLTLDSPCDNKQLAIHPLSIRMPNGDIITSTHTAILSKQDLPIQARKLHLFPGLNNALLYIETLFDNGCQATFDDMSVLIFNKGSGKVIINRTRDPRTNLYMINLTQQNKLMTEFTTPGKYIFRGVCMSASQKAHWCIITTHHSGSLINLNGG